MKKRGKPTAGRELKEARAQQAASAEILAAIGANAGDAVPVFEAIVRCATRLFPACNAGLTMVEANALHLKAFAGPNAGKIDRALVARFYPLPLDSLHVVTARVVQGASPVFIADSEAPGVPELFARAAKIGKFRAALFVPLVLEGRGIGALVLTHPRPRVRFTPREHAVLDTFARQAVIAIENARLFNALREKTRQVELASRHKSEFLANMSHELRTPLNAIIGFSEAMKNRLVGEVNEKQARYLGDILDSGEHLLSLINDVLDLSKIEAGRMDLQPSSFSLPRDIASAVTAVRERALRHDIELAVEVDGQLGEWRADRRKLKQILLNLLSNAVKFTPDGGRIELQARPAKGGLEILVRDSGPGISTEDQASLFKEFGQVGQDAARKAEGTGLGLALTKRLVELHGGAIRVDSAPGKGATFAVTLPQAG